MLNRIKWEGAFRISDIGLDLIGLERIEQAGAELCQAQHSWLGAS